MERSERIARMGLQTNAGKRYEYTCLTHPISVGLAHWINPVLQVCVGNGVLSCCWSMAMRVLMGLKAECVPLLV